MVVSPGGQTVEDVDELQATLESLDDGEPIRVTYRGGRSTNDRTATGRAEPPFKSGTIVRLETDDLAGDINLQRRGEYEVTVEVTTQGGSRTIGWLVEIERLAEDNGGDA